MTELADLTVTEMLDAFRGGWASPSEALESCIGRIERLDPAVNSILTWPIERSRRQAEVSTRRWQRGEARPLEGVPYGVKDVIDTAGIRTTGGSRLYASRVPKRSAALVERLETAGAVLAAKTQTFEFASGSTTETANPWDLTRWACGSSSGSAAAVAAHQLPLAIGTDTGGSIIGPASFCGAVGMKPTYGRVPRTGIMPVSWTLDHAGPLARTVADIAVTLRTIAGYEPGDPTSSRLPVPDYVKDLSRHIKGVRVGVPTDWFFDICDPEVEASTREAAETLRRCGAKVFDVVLPSTHVVDLNAMELTIVYAELASLHEATLESFDEYGEEFQRIIVRSQFTSATDYLKALRARHLVQLDFQKAFETVDVIIAPAQLCTAPRLDHLVAKIGSRELPLMDVATRPMEIMNLTGVPTVTVPGGFDAAGLPIGVQIAGRPFEETMCLRVAHAFEQATEFHSAMPSIVTRDIVRDLKSGDRQVAALIEKPVSATTRFSVW